MSRTVTVELLYFAKAREVAGLSSEFFQLSEGAHVAFKL
jgi:hypothetical protein